ncbi:homeobox-leucine zipper protein HDG8-like [Euphorbia lathyris]|uniref:homeobox-leucine zipper protein HDG8-like n=1 Tax=Euphorbia lathyris TaxID=212925 RepID=UPI003313ECA1
MESEISPLLTDIAIRLLQLVIRKSESLDSHEAIQIDLHNKITCSSYLNLRVLVKKELKNSDVGGLGRIILPKVTSAAIQYTSSMMRFVNFWTETNFDGRLVIHCDSYKKAFPRTNHFKTSNVPTESSKSSGTVPINAMTLVEMFLDSSKWVVDLFLTIITKASIMQVLETGTLCKTNTCLKHIKNNFKFVSLDKNQATLGII